MFSSPGFGASSQPTIVDNKKAQYTINHYKDIFRHTDIHKITWKIPKFSQILQTKTMRRKCFGPKNTVVEIPNTNFQIKMSFFASDCDVFSIDFYYLSGTPIILDAELEIILDRHENIKNFQKYQEVQANFWQRISTIKNPSNLYYGNSLDVGLKFIIYRDASHKLPQLTDDLKNLLTEGSFSDVTMISDEGEEFKVHKSMLSIRSKVLKAHFEHNTTESVTNVVETKWETAVLQELLTFLYTNDAPHVDDHAEKLLAAADYYQLEGLKTLSEKALIKRLTVENAIDTLQLAEMHSAIFLRDSTLEFIKHGRARRITESHGWANVPAEIIKMIYEFVMADEIDDILASALNEL